MFCLWNLSSKILNLQWNLTETQKILTFNIVNISIKAVIFNVYVMRIEYQNRLINEKTDDWQRALHHCRHTDKTERWQIVSMSLVSVCLSHTVNEILNAAAKERTESLSGPPEGKSSKGKSPPPRPPGGLVQFVRLAAVVQSVSSLSLSQLPRSSRDLSWRSSASSAKSSGWESSFSFY